MRVGEQGPYKWSTRGKTMDINKKFMKALELQDQGYDRRDIYKTLGYQSIDAFTKMMKKFGYKYDKLQEKYIQVTGDGQMTSLHSDTLPSVECKEIKSMKNQLVESDNNAIIDLKNDLLRGNIMGLAKHYDEIMGLLTWYKAYGGQMSFDGSRVIEVVQQGIKIELPKSESTKTSIRVNKEVWEQFGQFAEKHNEFVKGDLLAQALKEYMETHKE